MIRVPLAIPAADGTLLRGWRCGENSGSTVCLLLHGSGDGGYVWDQVCESLALICDVVVLDFRGHGDSQPSRSGDYGVVTHVLDVECVIEQLKLSSVILCGHSLGGQVSVQLACGAMARRVVGAVIVDVCPHPSETAQQQAGQYLRQSVRRYETREEYVAWLLHTRPLLSREVASQLASGALKSTEAGGYEPKLDPRVCDPTEPDRGSRSLDWQLAFASVECPVLLVRGIASAMMSVEAAHSTLGLLRFGRLATVRHAGHAVMSDNPGEFAAPVLQFVREMTHARGR